MTPLAPVVAALGVLLHFVPEATFPGLLPAATALLLASLAMTVTTVERRFLVLPAVWLAWSALSIAWSVDKGQSVFTLSLWAGFVAVVFLGRSTRHAVTWAVAAGVVLCVAMALWQRFEAFPALLSTDVQAARPEQQAFALEWARRGRVIGPFSSPDALAAMLIACLPILAAVEALRKPALVVVTAGIVTLVMTRSVGAVLSLSAAVALVAGVRLHAQRNYTALAGLAGVALVPSILVVAKRMGDASEPIGLSVRERFEDWQTALSMMAQMPMGAGAGAYESAFNALAPQGRRYSAFAHSALLQSGVELGVAGFLVVGALYLALVLWALSRARGGSRREAVLAVGVIAACMHHQLDYTLHIASGVGLALVVGMLLDARVTTEREPPVALRAGLALALAGCAWLGAGAALSERGIPRTPVDVVDIARTERGATLLAFDAHAQMSLADDLLVALRQQPSRELIDAYLHAADDAARLAPWHPGGPMMRARMLAMVGSPEVLEAYGVAIARSCCSKRLHEERRDIARKMGRDDVVAEDDAWLERARR